MVDGAVAGVGTFGVEDVKGKQRGGGRGGGKRRPIEKRSELGAERVCLLSLLVIVYTCRTWDRVTIRESEGVGEELQYIYKMHTAVVRSLNLASAEELCAGVRNQFLKALVNYNNLCVVAFHRSNILYTVL